MYAQLVLVSPLVAAECSGAGAKDIELMRAWIVRAACTCVTCAPQRLREEHLGGRGMRVKVA